MPRLLIDIRLFKSSLFLLPIVLGFTSEILLFIAPSLGTFVKMSSLFLMIFIILVSLKTHKIAAVLLLFLSIFFVYCFVISFNHKAGFESLIRFLFPLVVLLYSYYLKNEFKLLLNFFIFILIINFLAQVLNYILWLKGYDLWFFQPHDNGIFTIPNVSGVMRGTGIMGFFSLYGYFNMIMFFIIQQFYDGKRKKLLLIIALLGLFSSISYKGIMSFILVLFLFSNKKLKIIQIGLVSILILGAMFPVKTKTLFDGAVLRANAYVFEGNSARAESYKVMFKHTSLFGEGLGSFGGPSSVKYNSPFYDEVNFNWHGLKLGTTDTYFPHLFIELGLIASLLYLIYLFIPFYVKRINLQELKILLIIYITLFFDSLFSFSLNNLSYLFVSLLWCFPIKYYYKAKD